MSPFRACLLCLCLILPSGGAFATEVAAFDVSVSGLRVARLTVAGALQGGRYAASMHLRTTGVASVLRRVRFAARSEGVLGPAGAEPRRYVENVDTGRRRSQADLVWQGGMVVPAPSAPVAAGVDPAPSAGAVDPMTALFFGLRDVAAEDLCRYHAETFDGTRRAEVVLSPLPDGADRCAGVFRRLSGYSATDMAERAEFALVLHYVPSLDGRWRLDRIEAETIYGKAVLKRR